MTIRRKILISFGVIIVILLVFGIYMTQLYSTLSIHMSDVNDISNTINTLQEINLSQTHFIEYGAHEDYEFCQSQMTDLTLTIRSSDIDLSDFDLIKSEYLDILNQMHDVKEQLLLSSKLSNQISQDILSTLKMAPMNSAIDTSDILITFTQGLDKEDHYKLYDLEYTLSNLNYLTTITSQLEMVSKTTADQDVASYALDLGKKFATFYEVKRDLLKLNENLTHLTDQLNEDIATLITSLDHALSVLRTTNQQIVSTVQNVYRAMFAVVLLAIIIILTKIISRISEALSILTEGTERIASGEYNQKVDMKGNDEFTKFTSSINTMANRLKEAHYEVLAYNSHLEEMVAAKTTELQHTKDDLEHLNRKLTNEKEKYIILAMTDALTGLKNRAFLISYIDQAIKEAKRYHHQFSIMLLDIDFFKHVNDDYGHHMGDEVLKGLAEILNQECRQSDIIARYGGEEFIIVFANTDLENATTTAERIRSKVANTSFTELNLTITISAGVTAYRGDDTGGLIERVDALQYEAKRSGRNCIVSDRTL